MQTDTGEYTCHATNFEGTTQKTIVVLLANGATMKKDLSNKTVIEGSSVFWHCDALGYPSNITYQWFKDKIPIISLELGLRSHIQEGEFGISSVNKNDIGWYTCEANNGFETSAKSTAFLDVHYKPKIKSSNKRIYIVAMNKNGTISCEVDSNPPSTFIQWIKDGRPLNPTRGQTFQIINATFNDAGIYSCQAFNAVGGSDVLEMHVIVSEPPLFSKKPPPIAYVNVGETFSMECTGFGDPPPVQYWLRKMVRYPTKILHISNVSHSDYGNYRCILSNEVATVHHDLMLYVKNTRPQCPNESHIHCLGETGFNVSFIPGYDGNSLQNFRLHHREIDKSEKDVKDWAILNISTNTNALIETHTPFSFHEFLLETSNKYGRTFCTLGIKNVCSRPEPPKKVTLDSNNVLRWESSLNAETYKIAFRRTSQQPFAELAETKETFFPLQLQILAKSSDSKTNLELTIRSSQSPFPDSKPSEIFRASYANESPWTLQSAANTDPFNEICGEEEEANENEREQNHIFDVEEHTSAVNTMLREKYMENPEYQKLNLLDQLRLEQLKQEFCSYLQ
uniref:Ig-like domain-containing protein n=1 Tax=Panagrolaimus superbus TaxID=310955 RepID=A0A914Y3H9_9BILA